MIRAMVVAKLTARSFPIAEVPSSNPVIDKNYWLLACRYLFVEKTKNKEEFGIGPLKTIPTMSSLIFYNPQAVIGLTVLKPFPGFTIYNIMYIFHFVPFKINVALHCMWLYIVYGYTMYTAIQCIWLYNVYGYTMYMAKQCIWLNNECYYAMYMAIQCILLCNVFGYAMYVDMQCMCLWVNEVSTVLWSIGNGIRTDNPRYFNKIKWPLLT